jgi:NAD+ kinase
MLPLDVFIVRHSESEGNRALSKLRENSQSVFTPEFLNRHNINYPLTDKGKDQCPVVGAWLKNWLKENKLPYFDRHVVSTHVRALESAALLDLPEAEWRIEFQLHERDNGLWGIVGDKKWQERHDSQRNHHFYTPMPDGESIANVCDRLRNFISALDSDSEEINRKRVIVVAHGDVMRALRVIFEQISPDRYDELVRANSPDFRIGNGQIIHYTRVDPIAPSNPKTINYKRFGWVRSINPWCPDYAGHDWRPIEQRRYSNDELLAIVNRFPLIIND